MEDWKEYKLGDVCQRLKSGKGINAQKISIQGKYPVIGGNGLRGYTDEANFIGQAAIIGRQGAYCGNVRYFNGAGYMTEHAIVVVGNELANTKYLSCKLSLMKLGHLSAQSAQPGLSVQLLSKLPIKLPTIKEQNAVAAIIQSLDDKIELNRRINDNLEQQAQALFKAWFVDFEPFKDGRFVDSELGRIPEGWKIGLLNELIELQSGFAFKSDTFVEGGEYRLITIKAVQDGYLDISGASYINEVPIKMPHYCFLQIGDMLLSLTGNVGRVCIVSYNNLLLNQRVAKIKPIKELDRMFAYTLFRRNEFKNRLIYLAKGTAQLNLSPIETIKQKVIIPPRHILNRYGTIANIMYDSMIEKMQESIALTKLRDTLLPRLMSGELNVNTITG